MSAAEPLYCTYCHQFLQIPVTLQCGHHMCLACVDEIIALQLLKEENYPPFADANTIPDPFVCQVMCRTCTMVSEVLESSDFPINEALQALVEKVSKYKKCSLPRCNNAPEVDCVPCQRSLCLDCFEKLHNLIEEHEKSKLGTIRKLMVNTCIPHSKPYEYFCRTCDTQLCKLCLLIGGNHKEHDVKTVIEHAQKCSGQANEAMERSTAQQEIVGERQKAVQSMLDSVNAVHRRAEEKIGEEFDKLIKCIEDRKQKLLSDSSTIQKYKAMKLGQQAQCIGAIVSQLSRYTESLRQHVRVSANSDIIYCKQRIDTILSFADKLYMHPCYNDTINLATDVDRFMGAISKFGTVNLKPARVDAPTVQRNGRDMSLTVSWYPKSASHISKYIVRLLPEIEGEKEKIVYTGTDTSCAFTNVSYNKIYQFTVQAFSSEQGEGDQSDPSAPFSIDPIKVFTYARDFDDNGLIYWLGSDFGTSKRFRNPATTGKVEVICSSMNSGTPELATGRTDTEFNTYNTSKSWIMLNLKRYSIIPERYSIKHGGTSNKPDFMRNWEFQGSKDGLSWVVLRKHENDESGFSWSIPETDEDYQYFKILQTGRTSRGTDYLEVRGFFEIYGRLVRE